MLVSQAIARAGRILFAGQVLTASQETAALENAQAMFRNLPGTIGATWCDVVGYDGYVAGEDERITCFSGMSISLPDYVTKCEGWGVSSTTDFNASLHRTPRDGARVQVIDSGDQVERLRFYRADRAEWCEVSAMALTSETPLNGEFDEYLPAMLAEHMSLEFFGSNFPPLAQYKASRGRAKIRARLKAARPVSVDAALLNLSIQTGGTTVESGTRARPDSYTAALAALNITQGELVIQTGGVVSAGDSGNSYSNNGASTLSTFTLPPAEAGLRFGFIVQSSAGLRVQAASGDTVQVGQSQGDYCQSGLVGSAIEFQAVNDAEWIAISVVGEWSVT